MPRIFGHDLLALILAAIAIYAVGFVMYGLLFEELWMELAGVSQADYAGQEWKMALSPVMPILTVLALAKLIDISGRSGLGGHLSVGFLAWLGFAFTALMYGWVYGADYPFALFVMDSAHLLIGTLLAASILVWRKQPAGAGEKVAA